MVQVVLTVVPRVGCTTRFIVRAALAIFLKYNSRKIRTRKIAYLLLRDREVIVKVSLASFGVRWHFIDVQAALNVKFGAKTRNVDVSTTTEEPHRANEIDLCQIKLSIIYLNLAYISTPPAPPHPTNILITNRRKVKVRLLQRCFVTDCCLIQLGRCFSWHARKHHY